ncbi:MAG: MOSC domain-containing protein [Marinovum sp.]|nr:MOSC domain-containing protein [Marinovum sp.]
MERLSELIARVAQPGRVDWVGLRPARRLDMVSVDQVDAGPLGLAGDHGKPGKRAVSLVQAEHLAVIGAYLGRGPVAASDLRRNVVVSGINLISLRGRRVWVGDAILKITGPCAPCSRMEEAFGHGGYAAVRGHGGVTADVVEPGTIRLGDSVRPLD